MKWLGSWGFEKRLILFGQDAHGRTGARVGARGGAQGRAGARGAAWGHSGARLASPA